ncbi:helix-turn-helix domain-containing protein [Bacillus wiedmannii]|uniref:helix-turn-helix domain-containing protein n=1 Tax=Bacillus wiedmannii TaxID=1890302 RepID=UPI000BFB8037|nr:helix-turn-helix domain-containing protein [Bacillus wiedmannii]PHD29916.1 DNA-binding protein [Bacillus wiedmannii]
MTEYIIQPTDTHQWVRDNVMTTPEAIEILGVSRSRMSRMIKDGKIVPAKKLGCISLFLKSDLEKKKEELIVLRKKYQPNA